MPGDRYVCATCGRPSGDPLCCPSADPLPLDPAAVRELLDNATPGPWASELDEDTSAHRVYALDGQLVCCVGNMAMSFGEEVASAAIIALAPALARDGAAQSPTRSTEQEG